MTTSGCSVRFLESNQSLPRQICTGFSTLDTWALQPHSLKSCGLFPEISVNSSFLSQKLRVEHIASPLLRRDISVSRSGKEHKPSACSRFLEYATAMIHIQTLGTCCRSAVSWGINSTVTESPAQPQKQYKTSRSKSHGSRSVVGTCSAHLN